MSNKTTAHDPAHIRPISKNARAFGSLCFVMGFVSIAASIAIWVIVREPDPAHGERFGIFVGLWAPTFFVLSNRYNPLS